jgi:hypothetical protein
LGYAVGFGLLSRWYRLDAVAKPCASLTRTAPSVPPHGGTISPEGRITLPSIGIRNRPPDEEAVFKKEEDNFTANQYLQLSPIGETIAPEAEQRGKQKPLLNLV